MESKEVKQTKRKWFYEPQRIFKEWRKRKGKNYECVKQVITQTSYEEELYLREDGNPYEYYTLYAYKNTGEIYLLPKYGEPVRIYLRKHNETKPDTPKCKKCKGRTALIKGSFVYEPDSEPYKSGIEETSLVKSGEAFLIGYKCDTCGNIQDLHED